MILYLVVGLLAGGCFGYFILKLSLQKNFVSKILLEQAEKTISELRLDNATRPSKEELTSKYVSKELHENIKDNLTTGNGKLEEETRANKELQATILRLTSVSEQKLSKTEVEQNYVPRESFDIVDRKLFAAENELTKRHQTIM